MRKYYLDNIRWVTIVCVAIYHVFLVYSGVVPTMGTPFSDVQYQDGILYLLYPWFMILLFIVSGMCSRYYLEDHTTGEFIRSRTRKLLVPSTLGVLLFGWAPGYINVRNGGHLEEFAQTVPFPVLFLIVTAAGIGVLWFIQMLWLFSILLVLVRRYEKGRLYAFTEKTNVIVLILLGIPVWLSGQVLNTPVIVVYRFGIYPLAFFLGYFVFAHDEVIDRLSKWKHIFIPVAVALGILYVMLHFGDNYADMPVVGSFSAVAYAWIAILAIFGGFKAWGDKTGRISSFMSSKSWGLYIFHNTAINAMALFLKLYTSFGALPCYILTMTAAFAGGLAMYEIISRIPFLRFCILGIKKERADGI